MSRLAPRRVRLDLAYDGTDFCGWQIQPGQRTVQGVLTRVLTELQGGEPVTLRGSGRTDSGVHARQQVADCELRTRMDDAALLYALRRILPPDVRPLRVSTTRPDFHSQMQALSKTYHYRLDLTHHGDPFAARFALHCPHALDDERLRGGLALLPGRRDWSGFASSKCTKTDRIRYLTEARFERGPGAQAIFVFSADGFLQYMVRNLVGTLLELARARIEIATLAEILKSRDRSLGGPTAPARGLWLERVRYRDDDALGAADGLL